jgi:hypothetical protein
LAIIAKIRTRLRSIHRAVGRRMKRHGIRQMRVDALDNVNLPIFGPLRTKSPA